MFLFRPLKKRLPPRGATPPKRYEMNFYHEEEKIELIFKK